MGNRWKIACHRGDGFSQPRLIIWHYTAWWLVIRFGREKYPLFSERNQGARGKHYAFGGRWHYLFGKRLSWWYDGS